MQKLLKNGRPLEWLELEPGVIMKTITPMDVFTANCIIGMQ